MTPPDDDSAPKPGDAAPIPPPPPAPAPDPSVAPKPALKPDKRPLPLLSRAKLKKPRQIGGDDPSAAPGDEAKERPAARPRRRTPLWARLLLRVVAYATLVGLSYMAVHFFRQTQVQGFVKAPPGGSLPEAVFLVRDFSEDVRTLRDEYRLASEPFEADMQMKQESLHRVDADLAGLNQRKALISQQIADDQKEIEAAAASSQQEVERIWKTDGGTLDAEYADKLGAFKQTLLDRAKQMNLSLLLDDQPSSPEVWVNAFRLVLYNPPPSVKAPEQRAWLEKQLADWHVYEADWSTRRDSLKGKTDTVRQGVGTRIAGAKLRMEKRRQEIADADSTAVPLQSERDTLKTEADQAEVRERQQRATYAGQLSTIPERNVIEKIPLTSQGRFSWAHLEQQTKYPPGNYFLWAQVKNGDGLYWALVPFTVTEFTRLDLVLQPGAFLPAADLLK